MMFCTFISINFNCVWFYVEIAAGELRLLNVVNDLYSLQMLA